MTRIRRSRRSDDRGAVAVEFALVLPLLLAILYGILDFGRAYNAQETLTQAARVGARLQSLGKAANDSSVQKAAKDAVSSADVTDIAVKNSESCTAPGVTEVTVTVTGSFVYLGLPLPGIHIEGKATAPC